MGLLLGVEVSEGPSHTCEVDGFLLTMESGRGSVLCQRGQTIKNISSWRQTDSEFHDEPFANGSTAYVFNVGKRRVMFRGHDRK